MQETGSAFRRHSEEVYRYLSDGIVSGRWRVGDKLPSEAELCRLLEASRSTVRSAIDRLNGVGLVKSHQGKGTFVCRTAQPADISIPLDGSGATRIDVFEFRKIIESESAALAAMRATAADVGEIEESILGMAEGRTQQEVAEQDLRFHQIIARCSGNEIIRSVFEIMHPTYREMFMTNVARMHKAGVLYHRRILLAIQSRDMQAARQCMLEHLDDAMRTVCGADLQTP